MIFTPLLNYDSHEHTVNNENKNFSKSRKHFTRKLTASITYNYRCTIAVNWHYLWLSPNGPVILFYDHLPL